MLKKWMGNKAGYVSIETVIVAGLVIALGAFAMQEFYTTAQSIVEASMKNVEDAKFVWFPLSNGAGDVVEVDVP